MLIVVPAILKIEGPSRDGRSAKLGVFLGVVQVGGGVILDGGLVLLMSNGKVIILDGLNFAVAEESQPSYNNQFE